MQFIILRAGHQRTFSTGVIWVGLGGRGQQPRPEPPPVPPSKAKISYDMNTGAMRAAIPEMSLTKPSCGCSNRLMVQKNDALCRLQTVELSPVVVERAFNF
jgi:hypothetical protein